MEGPGEELLVSCQLPEGEAGRMKLLILANTLPILVEASDQGPLSTPHLFSPTVCSTCSKQQRPERDGGGGGKGEPTNKYQCGTTCVGQTDGDMGT